MNAIILAAGVGQRLGDCAGGLPKSLLSFGGRTLLERCIDGLLSAGVGPITVVVGYQRQTVQNLLQNGFDNAIRTVYNPHYNKGSMLSLWSAKHVLRDNDDVLIMDADVLYTPEIMRRLVYSSHENCFLIDRCFEAGDEPVKLCVKSGRLIEFRKHIAPQLRYDMIGESVGFFRFSDSIAAQIARRTGHYVDTGAHDEPYEEAIRDVLLGDSEKFGYEDITGLPWIEIDFPEDVERATREVFPKIAA